MNIWSCTWLYKHQAYLAGGRPVGYLQSETEDLNLRLTITKSRQSSGGGLTGKHGTSGLNTSALNHSITLHPPKQKNENLFWLLIKHNALGSFQVRKRYYCMYELYTNIAYRPQGEIPESDLKKFLIISFVANVFS